MGELDIDKGVGESFGRARLSKLPEKSASWQNPSQVKGWKMAKTVDEIIQIIAAGAGVVVDARGKTKDELVEIVAAARTSGTTVTVTNVSTLTQDELIEIAAAGRGKVMVEL